MSVSTGLKRMTAAALGVLLLLVAMLLLLPQLVSHNDAHSAVTQSLRAISGVEPATGSAQLSLLPRPSILVRNVLIQDGSQPPFRARSVLATVRLMPLLLGRVEIASLEFERPHLQVGVAADGTTDFGLPLTIGADRGRSSPSPEIRISNGTMSIRPFDSGEAEIVTGINGALAWSGTNLSASGSFQWRDLPASASLSIADVPALRKGERSALRLRIAGEPLRFGFDGGLTFLNGIRADGVMAVDAQSLRDVIALVSPGPVMRDGLGTFKVKAQATLNSSTLSLSGLSIELDNNRAEGGLTLRRQGKRTIVQGSLASETIDFTPYSRGLAMVGDERRDWSREPFDLSALSAIEMELRFSTRRALIRKAELGRVAASATIRNGMFTISVGDAQLYGGTLRGRAAVHPQANGDAEVKIDANLTNFNLEPASAAVSPARRLEGTGTMTVAVEGTGANFHEIARKLEGGITLTAEKGAMNGINVEQVLRRIERKPLSGSGNVTGGRTSFDRMNAKIRILKGNAMVEEATVESPLMQVRMSGTASVVHREYDLRGTATLFRSGAAPDSPQSFELPFMVIGSWANPFVLPDPTALIQRSGAAAPLLDAVRRQAAREKETDNEADGNASTK